MSLLEDLNENEFDKRKDKQTTFEYTIATQGIKLYG